jgi:hypothetical protein
MRGGRAGPSRARRFWTVGVLVLAASARAAAEDEPSVRGFALGAAGETIFEHTRASLRDPHFGVRFYTDPKVPGTLLTIPNPSSADANARAAAAGGRQVFMDVAFGERAPLVGWYDVHPTRSVRHARGIQLNVDAAAFLLLDFKAQSEALIDTDFRIGMSLDVRPWVDALDRLSLSIGVFHQSTHLADEYVLSAHTIQANEAPEANPFLPYRANPSYYAVPATLSLDLGPANTPQFSARVYAGGSVYFLSGIPAASHPDARVGVELRYGPPAQSQETPPPPGESPQFLAGTKHFGMGHGALGGEGSSSAARGTHGRRLRRGARDFVLAYEALIQREYTQDPATPREPVFIVGPGHWVTHHAMASVVFNLDTKRSTSNALALSLEYIHGRNQFGQLIEYDTVDAVAVGVSYYW